MDFPLPPYNWFIKLILLPFYGFIFEHSVFWGLTITEDTSSADGNSKALFHEALRLIKIQLSH